MNKYTFFLVLQVFTISGAFAKCEEFLKTEQLKLVEVDERTKSSVLNDYKNLYSKKADDMKAIQTFDVKGSYLSKFKSGSTDVILVYRKTARLVAVIENKKILYCGAY